MTRAEAKQAILEGKKITHTYFTPEEFIKLASDGSGRYESTDGCIFDSVVFWAFRTSENFNTGWEIWK
jgi:hypothetical protein